MRQLVFAAGVLAVAVLAAACSPTPAAQPPQPVPTTVTAEPVTVTETAPTTVVTTVTTTAPARKAATTRPKAEDCATGGCLDAARGLSQSDVKRETDAWLAKHPGWCAVGTTGAVAPC
ncbi:hypothetical protein ACIOD2_21920 [Amycolatopsis sp. NPDC088138]|uniref:hypothetical protein n=1 Tax=Amycolatopsis sp. NPDC088138 TaxID=3363938 RepID=UPI00380094A3